jgi:DNA polymerase-3 subunit delta'
MFFRQIIGNKALISELLQQKKTGRIPHAQLFLGADGSESFALAWAYLQYLNCENPSTEDSCGVCALCRGYQKLEHPDLYLSFPIPQDSQHKVSGSFSHVFKGLFSKNPYANLRIWNETLDNAKKQSMISVHESAEILTQLQLTAFGAKYKAVLMWLPEKLNQAAANKLLKIIEEPTDFTLFIFVGQQKEEILPTILSRLQVLTVKNPSLEEILSYVQAQNKSLEEAKSIVEIAQGNVLAVFTLLSPDEKSVLYFNQFSIWMRLCFKKDIRKILAWVEENAALGREIHKELFQYSLHLVQQTIWQNYLGKVQLLGPEKEFSHKFSPYVNPDNLLEMVDVLEKAYIDIERNAHAKILFLDVSFQLFKLFKRN